MQGGSGHIGTNAFPATGTEHVRKNGRGRRRRTKWNARFGAPATSLTQWLGPPTRCSAMFSPFTNAYQRQVGVMCEHSIRWFFDMPCGFLGRCTNTLFLHPRLCLHYPQAFHIPDCAQLREVLDGHASIHHHYQSPFPLKTPRLRPRSQPGWWLERAQSAPIQGD